MPRPTSATTIQRPDLMQLAWEYALEPTSMGLMGSRILPFFSTPEKTADYPKIPVEVLLKTPDTKRAARGAYNRSDWNFETGTFNCQESAWEEQIDDAEARLYSRFFDSEAVAAERAIYIIQLAHEIRCATLLFNATTFAGHTSNVGTSWSSASTATPRADIITVVQSMLVPPNAIAMSYKVFLNLINTAELKDALKYTNPVEMGGLEAQRRVVAQYFGLDEVNVSNAKKDSAQKGKTATVVDVWDDEYVLLYRRGNSMNLRDPSLGRTFIWTTDSPNPITVETYREEQTRSTVYRVRQNVDEALVFVGAGYLLGNITA